MIVLTVDEIVLLHGKLLRATGGTPGLRDPGLLESAVLGVNAGFGDSEQYPTVEAKAARLVQCIRSLTQILTQNGKEVGGSGGGNRAGKHPTPEQTGPESAEKPPPAPLTAAHNPKVVGSNPAPATKKP